MTLASPEAQSARPGSPVPPRAPAIAVQGISKTFRLPHEQYHTLKERMLHPFRPRTNEMLHAVNQVSVEIGQGEFFGIVGRNGSGKSTLLKCLAGIYRLDGGRIQITGRLSPFIELGVGFNPDLTARDNVIINAIMLGLTRKEAVAAFDDVIAFAELEQFIDLKLKNYSSGMQVRLAFAVAIQVSTEILLIDEVLAVGDAAFQQKCFDEFVRLKAEGRTIVFVTHDMNAVERFCDRALLLERGRVVDVGLPSAIARQYNELNFRTRRTDEDSETGEGPAPNAFAEVLGAWFESPPGEVAVSAVQGDACRLRMEVRFRRDADEPVFAFALQNDAGQTAFATSTEIRGVQSGRYSSGETAELRVDFDQWLGPGRYRLLASVSGAGQVISDLQMESLVMVLPRGASGGLVDLPHTFELARRPPTPAV